MCSSDLEHGLVAAWYARPSGRRIVRESDEHALTKDERVLMMQLEDLLLGHGRTGRKPRDADAIDAAEVDTWLAARREIPQPRWRDLADRYHRNEDTIRKRCRERELELERERGDQLTSADADVSPFMLPRQLPDGWARVSRICTVQSGRNLRPCQRG